MPGALDRICSIRTFPSLVKYLREDLNWPFPDDFYIEEAGFEYDPDDLGLDEKHKVKIDEIIQLRPLVAGQPWGVFFIKFEAKRLPVVVLRRVLKRLIPARRASARDADRATWKMEDLLFISSLGESGNRNPFAKTLAHFRGASREIAKAHPKYDNGKVYINPDAWFEGVPEPVWNFQIGGYQVCQKWLKDRRLEKLGRSLTDADIAHYRNIVTALCATITLMTAIDTAITAHGGWPNAFITRETQ